MLKGLAHLCGFVAHLGDVDNLLHVFQDMEVEIQVGVKSASNQRQIGNEDVTVRFRRQGDRGCRAPHQGNGLEAERDCHGGVNFEANTACESFLIPTYSLKRGKGLARLARWWLSA